jgi:hypothetical protein
MTPTPEERRIREIAAFENTAHADDIRELLAEYDRMRRDIAGVTAVIGQRDAYRAALTELRAASRGLAFFDQIKCARWNAAYQQASQVLGLEDET